VGMSVTVGGVGERSAVSGNVVLETALESERVFYDRLGISFGSYKVRARRGKVAVPEVISHSREGAKSGHSREGAKSGHRKLGGGG
jgi:hypothetical protein